MKKLTLKQREIKNGILYASVPVMGFLVFFFVPFLISFIRSFQGGIKNDFVGLKNYIDIFSSDAFILALSNTFKFMLIALPISITFSLIIAVLINHTCKNSSFFKTIFMISYVIPVSSTILIFQIIFEQSGIINSVFFKSNPIDFLHSDSAFFVLVGLYIWKNFGYIMILFLSGLSQIPNEYMEAAHLDGAGKIRSFIHITLPLLSPTTFFVIMISIVNSFRVFREAYALGGAYPHTSIYMIQHFMNNNFENLNFGRLSVSSIYVFLIIFIMILFIYIRNKKVGDYQL